MMGILLAVGSLSRGMAALSTTFLYDNLGPQITFAAIVVTIAVAIISLTIACHRLVPYGHKRI